MKGKFSKFYNCIENTLIYNFIKTIYKFFGPISNNFHKKAPLVILTPAKTGSTSVFTSLLSVKSKSVFKTHFVSKIGIDTYKSFSKRQERRINPHLIISRLLILKLKRYSGRKFIIVTIRNPIDQRVSSIFQSWKKHNLTLFKNVQDNNYAQTLDFVANSILKSNPSQYLEKWLESEIIEPFNIDVFSEPFPEEKGFIIFTTKNVSLLLMKLETMEPIFSDAIKEFLKTPRSYPLLKSNVGEEKLYKDSYKLIKNNLKIDQNTLVEIVNSRFFLHFYSGEAEQTVKKWEC